VLPNGVRKRIAASDKRANNKISVPVSRVADSVDVWVEASDRLAAEGRHHRHGGSDQCPAKIKSMFSGFGRTVSVYFY
jgi:hypothetical protein